MKYKMHQFVVIVVAISMFFVVSNADAAKVCGDTLCTKVKSCKQGELFDKILYKCFPGSDGWKITGYYLPLEKEFPPKLESVLVEGIKRDGSFDYSENNSTYYYKQFRSGFLKEVTIQGSGKTTDSKILQTWADDFVSPDGIKTRFYHYGKCAYTASGVCIPLSESSLSESVIQVAVTLGKTDMKVGTIQHGTLLRIPDLPSPWNARTYWATDVGEWSDKHIDVFTGFGAKAKADAYKITKIPPRESSRVLAIGFKDTNSK
jgi:hypothetical protein